MHNYELYWNMMIRTRAAVLPDVESIHAIIRPYADDGTLLPRDIPELSENVRDFVVAEQDDPLKSHCRLWRAPSLRNAPGGNPLDCRFSGPQGSWRRAPPRRSPIARISSSSDRLRVPVYPHARFFRTPRLSDCAAGRNCPTRFTRIAFTVPGFTTAMKSPWSWV